MDAKLIEAAAREEITREDFRQMIEARKAQLREELGLSKWQLWWHKFAHGETDV